MKKWLLSVLLLLGFYQLEAQDYAPIEVEIDTATRFQTVHSFGASDAWATQFTGNWPDAKKNAMADLLFSKGDKEDGHPKGIGLSAWRFNIGAGSAAQGTESGIKDPWRRTEGFLQNDGSYNWEKQLGQQWFLQAAKDRGVNELIAFVNSPPVELTKNGRAHSDDGLAANLSKDNYVGFASFLADVVRHFEKEKDIRFDYISPFNEPQWEWKGGQEGSPWNNEELAAMVQVLDSILIRQNIAAQIEITEAGQIDYLTGKKEKYVDRSDQIETFFNPANPNYVGNLKSVAPKVVAHSYFTTWDMGKLKRERERITEKLLNYPALEYGMSEYCILENNEEIKGKGKDLGMRTALYVARVIHADLTIANASMWHWWLAMSPYDFKDGLIYHDKEPSDGNFSDSKLLWALGNYSRCVRPGAKRIGVAYTGYNTQKTLKEGVLVSAYKNKDASIVIVAVNQQEGKIGLQLRGLDLAEFTIDTYITDETHDLYRFSNTPINEGSVAVPGKSVTTFVLK